MEKLKDFFTTSFIKLVSCILDSLRFYTIEEDHDRFFQLLMFNSLLFIFVLYFIGVIFSNISLVIYTPILAIIFALLKVIIDKKLNHKIIDYIDNLELRLYKWFKVAEKIKSLKNNKEELSRYLDKFFNEFQKKEIMLGLEKNLDISFYAVPLYGGFEMAEIRKGLEEELDVSWYAKPYFNSEQMNEIRKGLISRVDVSWYAKPYFDPYQMRQIREGLEFCIDVSSYAKPEYNGYEMYIMKTKAVEKKSLQDRICNVNYKIKNILISKRKNIPEYILKNSTCNEMENPTPVKLNNISISSHMKNDFTDGEKSLIEDGLRRKIDVTWYMDPKFNYFQMDLIKEALEYGVDFSKYKCLGLQLWQVRLYDMLLKTGICIPLQIVREFDEHEVRRILTCLKYNDFDPIIDILESK